MTRKKHIGILLIVAAVLSVLRTVIVTYGMEKNIYETETYYLSDSILNDIFTVIFVSAILVFLFIAVKAGRGCRFEFDLKNSSVSGASCMLGFFMFGAAFIYGYNIIFGNKAATNIEIVIAVFSVLSGISFLLYALRICSKKVFAFFALMPMILAAVRLLGDFIRTSATPLASSGAYHISGLAFALLYFYCEGKAFVNGGSAAVYLTMGYFSVLFLAVYSVPNLILHCFGAFIFDHYAMFSAVDLVAAGYIAARMSSVNIISAKKDLAMMLKKAGRVSEVE